MLSSKNQLNFCKKQLTENTIILMTKKDIKG